MLIFVPLSINFLLLFLTERLWNECEFIVVTRPGYPVPPTLPSNFSCLGELGGLSKADNQGIAGCFGAEPVQTSYCFVTTDMSASQIRQRLLNMGTTAVEGLIPPVVLAHIIRNRLYTINGRSPSMELIISTMDHETQTDDVLASSTQ
jgi:hypothetical protein